VTGDVRREAERASARRKDARSVLPRVRKGVAGETRAEAAVVVMAWTSCE
jgi:hypothetical protein